MGGRGVERRRAHGMRRCDAGAQHAMGAVRGRGVHAAAACGSRRVAVVGRSPHLPEQMHRPRNVEVDGRRAMRGRVARVGFVESHRWKPAAARQARRLRVADAPPDLAAALGRVVDVPAQHAARGHRGAL
eukprot:873539-Prymnesium_polylepis.1